jgi:hypothetical protein
MKICITPNSIKLFYVYFESIAPNFKLDKSTLPETLKLFYDKAMDDFSSSSQNKKELTELVLQHLSILPKVLQSELVLTSNRDLVKNVNNLQLEIESGILEGSGKLIDVINNINSMIGNGPIIPTVSQNDEDDYRFDAISFKFSKTNNQDTEVSSLNSFKDNIKSENQTLTTNVTINIVKSNNPKNYKFKAFLFKDVESLVSGELDKNFLPNDFVMLVVDANNNIVKFDNAGVESEKGSVPIYWTKVLGTEFSFKANNLALIFSQKYKISINEAEKIVASKLKDHLSKIEYIKTNLEKGNEVTIPIDINNTSVGFIEKSFVERLPLSNMTNLSEVKVVLKQDSKSRSALIIPEKGNESFPISGTELGPMLTEEFSEVLFSLAFTPNLLYKNSNGKVFSSVLGVSERKERLSTLLKGVLISSVAINSENPNERPVIKNQVIFGNYSFSYTYDAKNNEYTFDNGVKIEQVKTLFNEFLKEDDVILTKLDPSNPKISSKLKENRASANAGDFFIENDSVYFKTKKLVNLGIPKGVVKAGVDSPVIRVPVSSEISESGQKVIVFDSYSLSDFVKTFGTTNLIPNKNNELVANYPYLTFGNPMVKLEENSTEEDETLFQSLADTVRPTGSSELQEAALKWFQNHPLSKLISLNISDQVSAQGPNFVANFLNNAITLYKGSLNTDIFHESFHAFTQSVLSPKELEALYSKIKSTPGYFTVVVHGVKKELRFDKASNLEIEEYLAEQFRMYAQNRTTASKLSVQVKEFFDRLLTLIKSIFGDMRITDAVNLNRSSKLASKTFEALFSGNINLSNFRQSSTDTLWKSSEIDTDFSMEEIHVIMDSMKSLFNEFVTYGVNSNNKPLLNLMMQLSEVNEELEPEKYNKIKEELSLKQNSIRDKYTARGLFSVQTNSELFKTGLTYIKNNLIQQRNLLDKRYSENPNNLNFKFAADVLNKAVSNFGDEQEAFNEVPTEKGYATISALFLNNYSNLNLKTVSKEIERSQRNLDGEQEIQERNDEDLALNEDPTLDFNKNGNDESIQDLMDNHTKELLSNVTKHTKNGKGVPMLNQLGFKKALPLENMIAKTAKLLANTISRIDMYNKLQEAAIKDGEFKELLFKLGDPSSANTTLSEQKQWLAFWQAMNKADIILRQFVIEKNDVINGKESSTELLMYSGRTVADSLYIGREWAANFNELLELSPYAKEDENGKKYIDVKMFFEEFQPELPVYSVKDPASTLEPYLTHAEYIRSVNKKEYESSRAIKAYSEPFEFLNAFGIDLVDDSAVRDIIRKGSKNFKFEPLFLSYIVDSLKNKIEQNDGKLYRMDEIFSAFNFKNKDGVYIQQPATYTVKNALQELHSQFSNDNVSFMATTSYNEKKSEKALNSSLTVELNALKKANTYEELIAMPGMRKFDIDLNPFVGGNRAFVQLFNLDNANPIIRGTKNKNIEFKLEDLTGSKVKYNLKVTNDGETVTSENEKGVSSMASDENTKFITDFYTTLEGIQELPRMEAKSSSFAMFNTQFVDEQLRGNKTGDKNRKLIFEKNEINQIFSKDYTGDFLYQQFKGHLSAEMIRIQRINKLESEILNSDEEFIFDFDYLNRAKDFMIFQNLLSKDVKNKLKKLNLDQLSVLQVESLFSKELIADIEKDLVVYFKSKSKNISKNFNNIPISKSILEEYTMLNQDEVVLSEEDAKQVMFDTFTTNNFINNLNFVTLFIGDIGLFKVTDEDFHKRNAGIISSGKISAVDEAFLDFVNGATFNNYGFAKKFNGEAKDKSFYSYDGKLNTAVLEESKADSKYIDTFREIIGSKAESYLGMEEADGQGWITFDSYRLLNLSYNEWSDEQEALYQKMLSGENYSQDEILATFPVRKFQYFGHVTNDLGVSASLSTTAFHKYSLMPLIPDLIKGTKLEKLNEKLMREHIDYAVMKSGSKVSSLSRITRVKKADGTYELKKELDLFYNKDREVIDEKPFIKNIIDATHLKNVVFLGEGFKGKIPLPTQMRKMILHGLMENGVPVDYKGTPEEWNALSEKEKLKNKYYQWYQKYASTIKKLRDVFKNELLDDISMKWDEKKKMYTGDTTAIVNYIKNELEKNDFLPHEIDGIADVNGHLIDDLSFDLNSQKIESILTALVDKRLRKFKVNGEAMVQVSGAMFESNGGLGTFAKPTDEQMVQFNGTNDLKFYPIEKDAEGNVIISAMEVKISLQGDFKNLIYLKHPDKNVIAVKNADGKIDIEASRLRLNEAIKDRAWNNKHKNLLQMPGVRIPTQGPNALDVAIVAEFLPEWAGPIVILPSEMVIKTGGDYDIDKMFFMLPSILRNKKDGASLYEYEELTTSYEELDAEKTVLTKNIKSTSENIDNLYKEKSKLYLTNKDISEEVREEFEAENLKIGKAKKQLAFLKENLQKIKTVPLNETKRKRLIEENELQSITLEELIISIRNEREKRQAELLSFDTGVSSYKSAMDSFVLQIKFEEDVLQKLLDRKEQIVLSMKQSSTKGLENELLRLMVDKILDTNNIKDLLTPNGTEEAKPLSKKLERVLNKSFNKYEKIHDEITDPLKISPTTLFDYEYNLQKQQENSVGKDALGIAAVVSTFYALFTTFDSKLNGPTIEALDSFKKALSSSDPKGIEKFRGYAIKLSHNYVENTLQGNKIKQIALGKRYSSETDKKLIADTISQLINGFVDVAKDAWVFNIQGNKENSPTLLFMIMAGVPLEDAVYLSSNPLVLEYNKIKKEMQGVYSKVNYEQGDPIVENGFKLNELAGKALLDKYPTLFKKYKGLTPHAINNITEGDFSNDALYNRIGKTPTEEDIIYFAHYVEIESISGDLTKFQQANKHDTTKVSNITDAENNIVKNENFFRYRSAIPREWEDLFKENPIGVFNANDFIVQVFKQFFKIKNNPVVNQLAIEFSKSENVKKIVGKADTSRNAFKNDFIWFLYQNAVYNSNKLSYFNEEGNSVTNTFIEDDSINKAIELNFEEDSDNINITYSPSKISQELAMTTDNLTRSVFINKGKPDILEYAKYKYLFTEYSAMFSNVSEEELRSKYYFLASNKFTKTHLIKAIVLYDLKSPRSLFNSYVGAGSIIKKFIRKHPDLKNYSFISDLKFDDDYDSFKSNIYLPKNTGKKLMQTYLENINVLRNHTAPEVAEFFKGFDNYLVMQSGLNAASKYFMGPLISKGYVYNTAASQLDFTSMEDLFKVSYDQFKEFGNSFLSYEYKDGNKIVTDSVKLGLLEQFSESIFNVVNKNGWRQRGRGVNYVQDKPLNYGGVKTVKETPLTYSNVSFFNNMSDINISDYDFIFNPASIFESEFESIDDVVEMLKPFADDKVAFPNYKIIVPEETLFTQKEFDDFLLEYFGIDNTGMSPNAIPKSKIGRSSNMTISTVPSKVKYEWYSDETISSNSTKAIAFESKQAPKYASKHKNYIDALEGFVNKDYNADDAVWIFGASLRSEAYSDKSKSEYEQVLTDDFNNKYVGEIDKAIASGVTKFLTDAKNTGISLRTGNYLLAQGFKKVVTYGANFEKYYSYYKSLSDVDSQYFDPSNSEISISDLKIDIHINAISKILTKKFFELSEEQVANNGASFVEGIVKAYFSDKLGEKLNFARNLYMSKNSPLKIGTSPAAVYLEKYLMGSLIPALDKKFSTTVESKVEKSSSTSVKPTIDTSREWKGDLKSRPVFTSEGINTMRTTSAEPNEHFGNPFSEAGYGDTRKVPSIATAVKTYKEWLLTGYAEWLNENGEAEDFAGNVEQRKWILSQINQGKLDGATLLYAGKSEARGQGMHPTALAEVVEQMRSTQSSTSPSDFTNHSGGAKGYDAEWDIIGEEFGMVNNKHYLLPSDGAVSDPRLQAKGVKPIDATNDVGPVALQGPARGEAQIAVTNAERAMGRIESNHTTRNTKKIRNYAQVKNADGIFAIGSLIPKGADITIARGQATKKALVPQVNGGTSVAVQLGITMGKPTYVFNQVANNNYPQGWYKWDNTKQDFVSINTPVLTKNFAGIGTSSSTTEAGKQAIKDVYANTFKNTQSSTSVKRKTYSGKITELKDKQVFVFGSNPLGINGNPAKGTGGAALVAYNIAGVKQGEKMDNILSDSGKAYGITTVTAPGKPNSKTPQEITENIKEMYAFAKRNYDFEFLIADYTTSVGKKNLNGYTGQEMADMFNAAGPIPSNIVFNENFDKLISEKSTTIKTTTAPVNAQLSLFDDVDGSLDLWNTYSKSNIADKVSKEQFLSLPLKVQQEILNNNKNCE